VAYLGSGKSHTARKLGFLERITHFEADMFFNDNGKYNFNINKLSEAHWWCQDQVAHALSCGASVCVSNTFTTIREMKPYFEMAKKYGLIPNVITCQSKFGNIHDVPEETLKKMENRFDYDLTPLFELLKE